ncbi:hypothetical protein GQ53DRAFT_634662 [Thozetella sp. PMI_491]|nr:hypothetical protein GQ53DRAFT_634662 [Thozetella sp. PMI_491]
MQQRTRQPSPSPVVQVPRHPIPSMQDAFAESLVEATAGTAPKPKFRTGTPKSRRDELLDQPKGSEAPGGLWRRRPGQTQHELRRLLAQISFGVYLLLHGLANSQISVVSILQGHIDEVDEYLETTMEDMALAIQDLTDRADHLKLPLENIDVFEQMLEDRNFRLQIVEGNEKIEHIVDRTQAALVQWVKDASEGLKSTKQFVNYLEDQQAGRWRKERADVSDIFDAMKGNTDGWCNAFAELQAKGNNLNTLVDQLNVMVAEMEHRAGEVSRRMRFSIQPYTSPTHSPQRSPAQSPRHSRQASNNSTLSSSTSTPPPSFRIPNSPPRLSLRLSTFSPKTAGSEGSFFDMPMSRTSRVISQYQPVEIAQRQEARAPREISVEKEVVVEDEKEALGVAQLAAPLPIPSRNPRRISKRVSSQPIPQLEIPDEEDEAEEEGEDEGQETLFILQPRTYTPVPPAPIPSPRIVDASETRLEPLRIDRARDRSVDTARGDVLRDRSRDRTPVATPREPSRDTLRVESPRPLMDSPTLKADTYIPMVDPRISRAERSPTTLGSPRDPDLQFAPKQRTSLRQRVSLKTTPPESIQVPPPNAPELRRLAYPSPRVYQGPDSAYGSDMERPPVLSVASSLEPSLDDFPPPVMRPSLIPSPHSDQQYFRPVQASPHSPLQQRPHTSGTVNPRHTAYQQHQRNIPSAMGMSMLSNVTTMTQDTAGGKTLKKKRSAFGWLKKAFALDDEERVAFEQRKMEQSPNLYYDGKSREFLDGRRVTRSNPRPGYQQSYYG